MATHCSIHGVDVPVNTAGLCMVCWGNAVGYCLACGQWGLHGCTAVKDRRADLRRCSYAVRERVDERDNCEWKSYHDGLFHAWGLGMGDYPPPSSVGIVERPDGTMVEVPVSMVRFL